MASVPPSTSQDPIPPTGATPAPDAPVAPVAPDAQHASLPSAAAQPPSSDPTTLTEAPSVYAQLAQLQLSLEALLASRTPHGDTPLPPSVYLHPFDGATAKHLGSASAWSPSTCTAVPGSEAKLGVSVPPLTRQMVQETLWSVGQSLAAHSASLVPLLTQQPFGPPADAGSRDRLKLLLQEAGADSATASTMTRPLVLINDQIRPQTNSQRDPLGLDELFSRSDVGSTPASDEPVGKEDVVANVFSSRHLDEFKSLTRALHPLAETPHTELSDAVTARLATATLLARLSDRIAAQATHAGLEHLEEKMTLPPITEETMGQAQLSQTLTLAGGMLLVELEFYVAPPTAGGEGAWKPVVRSRIAFAPDPTAPPSPPSAEASYDVASGPLQAQVTQESARSGTLDLALLFQADLQFVALSLWELNLATLAKDRVKDEAQRRFGRFGSNLALLAQLDRASASVSNDCFALLQERTQQVRIAIMGLDLGLAASIVNFPQPYLTLVPSSLPWDQVLDKLDWDDLNLPRIQLSLRLGPGSYVGTGLQLTPALPTSTSGIHALQQAVLGAALGPIPPVQLSSSNTHLIDLLGPKGKPALDLVWDHASPGPSSPNGAEPQSAVLIDWISLPTNNDFTGAIVRVLEVLHTQRKLNDLLRQALLPTNHPSNTTDADGTIPSEATVPSTEMDALDAELDGLLAPGTERPSDPTRVRTAIELLPAPQVGISLRVPVFAPSAWTGTTLAFTVRAQLVPCGQGAGWDVNVVLAPSTTPADPADPQTMHVRSDVRQPEPEVLSTLEGYLRHPCQDLSMFVWELVGWATDALRSDPAWIEGV